MRRPPSSPDPERVRAVLASRTAPGPERGAGADPDVTSPVAAGWVPEGAPDAGAGGGADGGAGGGGHGGRSAGFGWPHLGAGRDPTDDADGAGASTDAGDGGRHRRPPRVVTLPVAFRGARVAVSARAAVGLVVVLVVAVVLAAVRVARAQEAAAPQVLPAAVGVTRGTGATGFSGSATASSSASTARASPTGSLVVDVVGQVADPGVVRVPAGSRVVDVLAAAGGALPGADLQRLNLARAVADGEQLVVPRPGETPPAVWGWSGAGGSAGGAGGASSSASATVVDLNVATVADLDTLPGVGPVLAQRILDWRVEHGRFTTVDELGEVSGIGDKLLAQLRPKVRV